MTFDIAIIGGGIVGLGTALALTQQTSARLVVLEAEGKLAAHQQSSHNSGVIPPASTTARLTQAQNCVAGRELMYRYCAENGIAHERCGKIVLATHEGELPALAELERRGAANGLQGLRRLEPTEFREHEPHVNGIAGLFVPDTGIVDYKQVAESYAQKVRTFGGDVRVDAQVLAWRPSGAEFVLATTQGEVTCRGIVNCAGLQSDRVAKMCGVEPRCKSCRSAASITIWSREVVARSQPNLPRARSTFPVPGRAFHA